LVARARHVYAFAVVKPVTTIGALAPVLVPVAPPLPDVHVTLYCVMGLPFAAGAENVTDRPPVEPFAAAGATRVPVGGSGTVGTVTAGEGNDAELVPAPFVAVTVHE
jgi:hypothetical protein